jgi:hypothetical protein
LVVPQPEQRIEATSAMVETRLRVEAIRHEGAHGAPQGGTPGAIIRADGRCSREQTLLLRFVAVLVTAWAVLASPCVTAAPQHATATRAELARWLDGLRARGTDVTAPLRWRYAFAASATTPLEVLSLELVRAGYAIEALTKGPDEGAQLSLTRVELLAPVGLERRNQELAALALEHGARYVGVDVAQ